MKATIRHENAGQLEEISKLIHLFEGQKNTEIVAKMKQIVPEFISNNSEFEKLDLK